MALNTLNTIQGGVQASYSDKYIKQALSNLGQRVGTRGDSIINQDFKIIDIKNYNVDLNDVDYICISYDPSTESMDCIYNSNVLNPDESNLFSSLDINDIVNITNIPIVEYIGNWNDLNNARIYKNHTNNSYFLSGICINNGIQNGILILEFDENNQTIINALQIYIDSNYIKYINAKSNNNTIEVVDNCQYLIDNTLNYTYSDIYNDISNFINVNDIINFLNDGSVVQEDTTIDSQYYLTLFKYYINILPTYAKNLYNESVYFSNNSYVGLKKYIIREFVKTLYNDSGFDVSDNNVFEVYFNKNYSFACLVNSTSNSIYVSYDILVKFTNSNIDTENLQYIEVTSNIDDKITAYKFYVTYLNDDKYVDEILVDKVYVLPYIKENSQHEQVWVLNDTETDIRTSGKDAGNPNIMMMSYVKANNGEQVSYSTDDSINISVLHTYEETDSNLSFKDLLIQYTNTNGINVSFNYYLPTLVAVNNSNYFEFNITLPNINKIIEENSSFERIVKNTLLMTFVDVNISTTEYNNGTGANYTLAEILHGDIPTVSYITVYWSIVKNNGEYTWQPVLNPAFGDGDASNLPVLDLGSMFSFTDFVDYYVHSLMTPDEYLFSWLVFDPISKQLKNTVSDEVLNDNLIHLVLKPDTADYYSTSTSTIKYDGYENNLNFAPKFLRGKGKDSQGNDLDIIEYKNGINGNEILRIKDTPDEYSNVEKFFTLRDRKFSDISKVNNDFVPNANESNKYPTFDFREMLTINQTLLNRLNIVSIAPDKRTYNAYFGHATKNSSNEYDYDVLAIGSNRQNHNMNSNITLTNSSSNFSEFDRIRFDLPTFNKEQAVYDKIVLKKMQGEGMYFATISVSNSNPFYIGIYTDEGNNDTFNVTKITKYMSSDIPTGDNNLFKGDNGFYCKKYKSFNAAKYLNDMDKYKLIVLDDDPQYPRNENNSYGEDGYILINIPENGVFSNIKMLGGFDNYGGDATSYDNAIKNTFTTFICYFQDTKYNESLKDKYCPKAVDNTGYIKNKLWLNLVNIQEIVTGSKYIQ